MSLPNFCYCQLISSYVPITDFVEVIAIVIGVAIFVLRVRPWLVSFSAKWQAELLVFAYVKVLFLASLTPF